MAPLFGLGTGSFIGSYTLIDGLGARQAGTPLNFIVWIFVLHGFPIVAFAFRRRRATPSGRRVGPDSGMIRRLSVDAT